MKIVSIKEKIMQIILEKIIPSMKTKHAIKTRRYHFVFTKLIGSTSCNFFLCILIFPFIKEYFNLNRKKFIFSYGKIDKCIDDPKSEPALFHLIFLCDD